MTTLDTKHHATNTPLLSIELPFPKIQQGKVRDLFDLGDYLLMVASDRVSAFNVLLKDGLPGKGILLTQISLEWFQRTQAIIPNHLAADHDALLKQYLADWPEYQARSMIIKKLDMLPIEAIVRGHITGNAWKDYQQSGQVQGHTLPRGLREFSPLSPPLFTPTTKAEDKPLTEAEAQNLLGKEHFNSAKAASLELFQFGRQTLADLDILLADTKFEFGIDIQGTLVLADEVLTPDSSRYWTQDSYNSGNPLSLDKQVIRNYLMENQLCEKPNIQLPETIKSQTMEHYQAIHQKLCQ